MKTTTLTNLLLLTSLTLFTACSNKAVEPENVRVSLEDLPLAQTYPMIKEYTPSIQNRIPQYQQNNSYVNTYVPNYSNIYSRANVRNYTAPPSVKRPYRTNAVRVTRKIEWDAKKLLGKKYVWGATGPRTYDCSGFTQKIYRDAGIKIPRVSRDQARVGQYVAYKNLKKGDLVFFDTHKKRTGKVTHVGIYLGAGNFIHASSAAKKIVVFNFNDKKFYKKRFLWARRVVKSNTRLAMK